MLGILLFLALGVLILIGAPVGVSLAAVALVGMLVKGGVGFTWQTLQALPFNELGSYSFVVIPMFLLMGTVASRAGIVTELYTAAFRWLARVRGSVFLATIATSTGFAAISGSTVVNAAVFTRIAMPEIIRLKFDRRFGAGCIAAAGTLAAMIPPSLVMVLFGTLTDTSIGALLIAGIVPGLLTAAVFCAGILIASALWPGLSGEADRTFSLREKLESLRGIWPLGVLVFVMLFGIYTGVMPPTAAGGVGAAATIALGLVRRKLSLAALWDALGETVRMTAALLFIILGGLMFGRMLLITGILGDLLSIIGNLNMSGWQFLLVLVAFYLFLGMFVDSISMMVMTLPFVFPIVHAMGFDAVWFGVIVVKLAELGTITPPVGINLFAVAAAGKDAISIKDVMAGIWPFILLDLIVLALLIVFPGLVTALVPANL